VSSVPWWLTHSIAYSVLTCTPVSSTSFDDDYCVSCVSAPTVSGEGIRGLRWLRGIHILGAPIFFWTGAPLVITPAVCLWALSESRLHRGHKTDGSPAQVSHTVIQNNARFSPTTFGIVYFGLEQVRTNSGICIYSPAGWQLLGCLSPSLSPLPFLCWMPLLPKLLLFILVWDWQSSNFYTELHTLWLVYCIFISFFVLLCHFSGLCFWVVCIDYILLNWTAHRPTYYKKLDESAYRM